MNNDNRVYNTFLEENFDPEFIDRLEYLEEKMLCIEQDEDFHLMFEGPGSMIFTDEYEAEAELDGLHETLSKVIFEKSHGSLKYTYRMGIDLDTGRRVAIQFRLEPDKVTNTGPNRMTTNLSLVQKTIQKLGHMNHRTSALTVDSIFHQDGKSLQNVRMIGVLNKDFQKWLTDMLEKYPTVFGEITSTKNKITKWDELINDPAFPKLFKAFAVTVNKDDIETYHVSKDDSDDEKQGDRKYKSTKLMWDHLRLMSIDFSPVGRGFVPVDDEYYGRGHNQMKSAMDGTNRAGYNKRGNKKQPLSQTRALNENVEIGTMVKVLDGPHKGKIGSIEGVGIKEWTDGGSETVYDVKFESYSYPFTMYKEQLEEVEMSPLERVLNAEYLTEMADVSRDNKGKVFVRERNKTREYSENEWERMMDSYNNKFKIIRTKDGIQITGISEHAVGSMIMRDRKPMHVIETLTTGEVEQNQRDPNNKRNYAGSSTVVVVGINDGRIVTVMDIKEGN